ncbi:MAG: GntR family transcriptional regulator [Bacteroidales bacterium]
MDFKASKTIYMQIADSICENILKGYYAAETKIPSVRELAAEKGVNPNTIMRSFMDLQSRNIIKNQRGIGYFVEPKATDIITQERKDQFFTEEFPDLLNKLSLLRLTKKEIQNIIDQIKNVGNGNK